MKAVIRADSTLNIGSGHIMRCLTLAEDLTINGFSVYFISKNLPGNMLSYVKEQGYQCFSILPIGSNDRECYDENFDNIYDATESIEILKSIDADLIIVDHYKIDATWHKMVKKYCKSIVVIDDLADRSYECDILIDQTFGRHKREYVKLVSDGTSLCLGSKYALVKSEYYGMRRMAKRKRNITNNISNVLIFLGGSDHSDLYLDVVNTLFSMDTSNILTINLVVGAQDSNTLNKLSGIIDDRLIVHKNINYMSKLMYEADIFVGASGSTTWERCSLYLPSIVCIVADNQKLIASNLEEHGAVFVWKNMKELKKCFSRIAQSPNLYKKMQIKSGEVCDAEGVYRVTRKITESLRG